MCPGDSGGQRDLWGQSQTKSFTGGEGGVPEDKRTKSQFVPGSVMVAFVLEACPLSAADRFGPAQEIPGGTVPTPVSTHLP